MKLKRKQAIKILDILYSMKGKNPQIHEKIIIEFMQENKIKCCSQCGLIE